jgi:hypothetical protein
MALVRVFLKLTLEDARNIVRTKVQSNIYEAEKLLMENYKGRSNSFSRFIRDHTYDRLRKDKRVIKLLDKGKLLRVYHRLDSNLTYSVEFDTYVMNVEREIHFYDKEGEDNYSDFGFTNRTIKTLEDTFYDSIESIENILPELNISSSRIHSFRRLLNKYLGDGSNNHLIMISD